jgi:gamma-glutamyltranspeptidase/glutathione hydrolase
MAAVSTTGRPLARARHGMVATPHRLATEAGVAALAAGGNAVDAAIAAAAAIAVTYPHMNGVGGDNFWLLFDAAHARSVGIDASGRAAAGATLASYRAAGPAMPRRGGRAALTVPGTVSGWGAAHRYSVGTMGSRATWASLLAPAIRLARDGFSASPNQVRTSAAFADLFSSDARVEVRATLWPIYHPDRLNGGPFVQRDLARTLETIAGDGAEAFYRGPLARRLAEAAAALGSPLREEDLTQHTADLVVPLHLAYRGGEAVAMPPPTQGFAALSILGLVEGFPLSSLDDADYVHLLVEATKLAFADRDRYLADPAAVAVPVEACLAPDRLARRRARIARDRALPLDSRVLGGDTVAIVTADGGGNAACVIQSLYHEFGAGIVAGDTGIVLQNRGTFFSLDPDHPNALAPGKRTAHTLIPAMYLRQGWPHLVYGTMGGEGQPQTQAALLTRVLERGLDPQAAVEAPRWLLGRTWGDESRALRLEARFDERVVQDLRDRGHDVVVVDGWSDLMGHAQMIRVTDDGLEGASDPRADGVAAGI